MRRTKNRLRNKIFKRVVLGQKNGIMQKYYARRAAHLISLVFDYKYLTVFRPWWYEQDWSKHPLEIEYRKFFHETAVEIERSTGISTKQLNDYLKQFPKQPRVERKKKEPKQQSIRKLKKPEQFHISFQGKEGVEKKSVTGEKAFTHQGYEFFIRHENVWWIVSDVITGRAISCSEKYKDAVKQAKEFIGNNFDSYLQRITEINN